MADPWLTVEGRINLISAWGLYAKYNPQAADVKAVYSAAVTAPMFLNAIQGKSPSIVGTIVLNGSWIGTPEWRAEQLVKILTGERPSQSSDFVNAASQLYLTRFDRLKPDGSIVVGDRYTETEIALLLVRKATGVDLTNVSGLLKLVD